MEKRVSGGNANLGGGERGVEYYLGGVNNGDCDDEVRNRGKGRNRQMAGEVEVETLEGSIKVASG